MELRYAIKFVADMERAVAFHRDTLGLPLAFQSPGWSEFATGQTVLALHQASDENPAGSVRLGFHSDDLGALCEARETNDLNFVASPRTEQGTRLAEFLDSEGVTCSVSG